MAKICCLSKSFLLDFSAKLWILRYILIVSNINTLELRTCTKCSATLPVDSFAFAKKKVGQRRGNCKACDRKYRQANKEMIRSLNKRWAHNNPDKIKSYDQKKCIKHKTRIAASKVAYRKKNKQRIQLVASQYYLRNKKTILRNSLLRTSRRRKIDPVYRLRTDCSVLIQRALKKQNASKECSILTKLPYSMHEMKEYIEKLFEPWMTWNNQGRYNQKTWDDNDPTTWKWQVDHIIPHSTFHYTSMDDDAFQKCWALDNLRPLSAKQNYTDGVSRTRHNG